MDKLELNVAGEEECEETGKHFSLRPGKEEKQLNYYCY